MASLAWAAKAGAAVWLQTAEQLFARRQSLPQFRNLLLESGKLCLGFPLKVVLPTHRLVGPQASLAGFTAAGLDLFPEVELYS